MIHTDIYINEPNAVGFFTARNFIELEKIMMEYNLKSCKINMTLFGEDVLPDTISIQEVKQINGN